MGSLANVIGNAVAPKAQAGWNKQVGDSIASAENKGFNSAAQQYGNLINNNTGANGYNTGYEMAQGKANDLTNKQASQAGAQSVSARQSAGMNRGRAAMDAGADTANTYAQQYGANMNNQQNAANQQLANQLNAQGTLMGAQLTNDQAQYNQAWNNQQKGQKIGSSFGLIGDLFSDGHTKDKTKVGLPDKDPRMVGYEKCGEKLKQLNPNKWKELHWEVK